MAGNLYGLVKGVVPAVLTLLWLGAAGVHAAQQEEKESYEPGIPLPDGRGKALLSEACTKCHDLKGLPAYQGYWNRDRWRSMVETMVENGAELDPIQQAIVTDYLTEHFGPGTRQ